MMNRSGAYTENVLVHYGRCRVQLRPEASSVFGGFTPFPRLRGDQYNFLSAETAELLANGWVRVTTTSNEELMIGPGEISYIRESKDNTAPSDGVVSEYV